MPNTFFTFKQFTIHQDQCAMKVCTDACLFGAWSAARLKERFLETKNILDIGTGTGLLSLMLAQNSKAIIDAVEIDPNAAKQAALNFQLSPWKDRLHIFKGPVATLQKDKKYDFIISNPPFYDGSLRSPDDARTAAMHDSELTFEILIQVIDIHLSANGYACLLMPFSRSDHFESLANKTGLYVYERAHVCQTTRHPPFRSMILISRNSLTKEISTEISIHDQNRQYTPEFNMMLKDYYLKL